MLVPRAGGTALAAFPPCLPAESGSASAPRRVGLCPAPAGILQAARSTGLCPGKPCRDTTAQPEQELPAAGQGQEERLVMWERSWRSFCPGVSHCLEQGHCGCC